MSYKEELEQEYQKAIDECEKIAQACDSKDGFMPIIEACYKRDQLAAQLKKL